MDVGVHDLKLRSQLLARLFLYPMKFSFIARPVGGLISLITARRSLVQGTSMSPSLSAGRYLLVNQMTYWIGHPVRGDIVVIRDSQTRGLEYIKRIVGLPSESITITEGRPVVNGRLLKEPYLPTTTHWNPRRDGNWVLRDAEYFVLGDNRDDSLDSRVFGPVQRRLVLGKAWLCYWPKEAWGRIDHGSRPR
jgi:signal peptidase I